MKNQDDVLILYKFYKKKLLKYQDKSEVGMIYVSEKAETLKILKILEYILEDI